MRELTSTEAVVEALGGIYATARITGVGYTAAANWKYRGVFPARYFLALRKALKKRGYTAPQSLWGIRELLEAAE